MKPIFGNVTSDNPGPAEMIVFAPRSRTEFRFVAGGPAGGWFRK